jgi:type II restriction/modification system DNA methylase subunit YeeA
MQTALTYRTNRDLFSNYYLDEHLPETEAWDELTDEELREKRAEIIDLWEREQDTVAERTESSLEEKFIRPLFRKLGIPFEVEETVQRGQRRPDYGFFPSEDAARDAFSRKKEGGDFYKDAVAVADAKRWGRPLDTRGSGEHERDFENPSYQIHVYLQETPARWAVLTDGKKWRLYYGPTSHRLDSYYEIDLPTVLEKGDLEDFKYFYLFFRHGAFLEDSSGECFLDEVYDESNVFAQELGEDLQDNIYEAIKVLSEGFMQYPDNDLSEDDLDLIHDSSLIYLYRLIFVLYAESEGRDLLDTNNEIYEESYSLNTLKQDVAEELDSPNPKYRDWQDNLWDRLDELFKLIDQGSKSRGIPEEDLYIPAYNGGLFRTDPDEDDSVEARFLANHQVGDAYLAEVIELLTRSQNGNGGGKIFVDYSSLDVRHLGSIYEGLLEYQLDVADEPLALEDGEYVPAGEDDKVIVEEGEVHLTTGSGERKSTGSYYTPEYVVEYIVEETLGPLVDDIYQDLLASDPWGKEGGGQFAEDFAERVFELKILDPAMGSGHFLTNAIDYLAREIINAQERQAEQQGIESIDQSRDINWARRQVAQRCIYGVDLNPLAVELAKVSLWLRTLAAEQPLAFLDHHLKTGNSLIGSDIEDVLDNGESATEDGQLTLQQSFARTRQQALEHVMDRFQDLLSIDNESLADVKEMEAAFEDVKDDPLYQRLLAMANVHTAEDFGVDIPEDAYKRMAEALRDDTWEEIKKQDWFESAQAIAEEETFFHWELEFPVAYYGEAGKRSADAGFDAVIGNPPYGYREIPSDAEKDYLSSVYDSHQYNYENYIYFTEKAIKLAKDGKRTSYIIPNTYLSADKMERFREYILNSSSIKEIYYLGQGVFDGVTLESVIQTLEVGSEPTDTRIRFNEDGQDLQSPNQEYDIHQSEFESSENKIFNISISPERRNIVDKMESEILLEKLAYVTVGINTGYIRDVMVSDEKEDDRYHRMVSGRDIDRYHLEWSGEWICYDPELIEEYGDKARTLPPEYIFTDDKILLQRTRRGLARKLVATLDREQYYNLNRVSNVVLNDEVNYDLGYILALLNSELLDSYFNWVFDEYEVKPSHLRKLPIKDLDLSSSESDHYNINSEYTEYINSDTSLKEFVDHLRQQTDRTKHDVLSFLAQSIESDYDSLRDLNLNLLDYLGNYTEGPTLPDIGLFQPTNSSILNATTEDYENLRVGDVKTERDGRRVTIYATARYKPENENEHDTDQWGYTETDYKEAFALTDLSEEEAALVGAFVPVAVEEADGFAGFRDNSTKTNSLIDRLKVITLPDPDEVVDDLRRYIKTKERAEELDEKIVKTDRLIDEIVYDLYGLTDEEIEVVESEEG